MGAPTGADDGKRDATQITPHIWQRCENEAGTGGNYVGGFGLGSQGSRLFLG